MHIQLIKFLENRVSNAKFDANARLHLGFTNLNWDNSVKIEKTIIANKNNEDEEKNLWKKNKQLKSQKQYQKQAIKGKTHMKTYQQVD